MPLYTSLLLHMDDVGLSDSSNYNHAITLNGGMSRNSAQSKFGGFSAYFDKIDDYLNTIDHLAFYLDGDFTFDCWIRFNSFSATYNTIYSHTGGGWFQIFFRKDLLSIFITSNIWTEPANVIGASWNPSTGVWYHVAVSRSGNNFRWFINGTQIGSTIVKSDAVSNLTGPPRIGWDGNAGRQFGGWIDEFRISKGIARWTANFTPPTEPYVINVSIVASPINISTSISATSYFDILIEASPISTTLSINTLGRLGIETFIGSGHIDVSVGLTGSYIEGIVLSDNARIPISIIVNSTLMISLKSKWIRENINSEPWDLIEQGDKFGYLNNKRWSSQANVRDFLNDIGIPSYNNEKKHRICGHWHKIPTVQYGYEDRARFNGLLDTLEFDTSQGQEATIINTTNDGILALFYKGGADTKCILKTISIDEDGNLGPVLDFVEVTPHLDYAAHAWMAHVSGSIYVVYYCLAPANTHHAATYSIAADGSISALIDSETFNIEGFNYGNGIKVHDNIFVTCLLLDPPIGEVATGNLFSFGVTDEGIITPIIDNLVYESVNQASYFPEVRKCGENSSIVAVAYDYGSSPQIKMVTINVSTGGSLTLLSGRNVDSGAVDCHYPKPFGFESDDYVGICYYNQSGNTIIKVYSLSNGVISLSPVSSVTLTSQIQPFITHLVENDFIFVYIKDVLNDIWAAILRIVDGTIDEGLIDNTYIQSPGINIVQPRGSKLSYQGLYAVAFTGLDVDGYISTLSFDSIRTRVKTAVTTPITNEPVIWPMT